MPRWRRLVAEGNAGGADEYRHRRRHEQGVRRQLHRTATPACPMAAKARACRCSPWRAHPAPFPRTSVRCTRRAWKSRRRLRQPRRTVDVHGGRAPHPTDSSSSLARKGRVRRRDRLTPPRARPHPLRQSRNRSWPKKPDRATYRTKPVGLGYPACRQVRPGRRPADRAGEFVRRFSAAQ